jgi:hypothetical protein
VFTDVIHLPAAASFQQALRVKASTVEWVGMRLKVTHIEEMQTSQEGSNQRVAKRNEKELQSTNGVDHLSGECGP